MNYRRLGRSGLKVSEISLGSWLTFGGPVDQETCKKVVRRAWDLGINFFDTADVYFRGEAEKALGEVLPAFPRHEVVVATKVMGRVWEGPLGAGLSRKHVMDAVEGSLRRLGLDYIDLYQAHAPDDETPMDEWLSTFNDLVRQGKVRYLGISNFSTQQTLDACRLCEQHGWEPIVSSQPPYNLLDRRVEPLLLPASRSEGIGLIVYSPLAQGVLTGKYVGGERPESSRASTQHGHFMNKWLRPQDLERASALDRLAKESGQTPSRIALAWVLRDAGVASAIVGATRVEQIEENVAASGVRLGDDLLRELDRIFPGEGTPS